MEWYKMLRTFTGSIIAPYYTYKYNRTVLVLLRSLYCRQAANYFLYLKLFFLFPFCLYFWMRQSHFTLEFFVCVLFLFIQCLSIFQTQPCINAQVYVDFLALLQFYCFSIVRAWEIVEKMMKQKHSPIHYPFLMCFSKLSMWRTDVKDSTLNAWIFRQHGNILHSQA